MKRRTLLSLAPAALAAAQQSPQPAKPKGYRTSPTGYSDTPVIPGQTWKVHDIDRPKPVLVTPGPNPGDPPSDAVVLFNGKDLSQWYNQGKGSRKGQNAPAQWKVGNGYFECVGKTGDLVSKAKFGDAQFHIEWSAPTVINGDSQWRGNSGIAIMGRYEIQVLDSWQNPTYADGQAGAIYGWYPPLVNPCRRPGEWNVYDIFWQSPKFEGSKLLKPAYVTVVFNGVLVHHHQEVGGPMAHKVVRSYEAHAPEESLVLQDHDTIPRFRNIWARRLS
jgi:hypothetical protein